MSETIDVGPVRCRHGVDFTEPCGPCLRGPGPRKPFPPEPTSPAVPEPPTLEQIREFGRAYLRQTELGEATAEDWQAWAWRHADALVAPSVPLVEAGEADRPQAQVWVPQVGERVLFEEDGNYVTGTVVGHPTSGPVTASTGWTIDGVAVQGDLGGIHSGPLDESDPWVWPLAPIIASLIPLGSVSEP